MQMRVVVNIVTQKVLIMILSLLRTHLEFQVQEKHVFKKCGNNYIKF